MSAAPYFTLTRGESPLLISLPHTGTHMPADLRGRYTAHALTLEDTDWHLDQLYAFAQARGVGLLVPQVSRYVIDLNRPATLGASAVPMYPGSNNTELCPTRSFEGVPIYLHDGTSSNAPDAAEIEQRCATFWQPYHQALAAELARLKAQHGYAILFDGHSIKSHLPWLFEGKLPDLNIGTSSGTSCAPSLREQIAHLCTRHPYLSHALDGRFKGGYITRQYGNPQAAIHAVQLEMCWSSYMVEAPPFALDAARGATLQPFLSDLIDLFLAWRPHA